MRKKTILEAMKSFVTNTLEDVPNDLLAIASEQTTDKETGEIKNFIKCEAEVQKGFDALSKCRFTVKIPEGKLKVTETQLEESDYEISFQGLQISYIDSKGTVYFRADDYSIQKGEI